MNWCPTHKTYSAKREPNSLCGRCYELWHLRCPELKEKPKEPKAGKLVKSLVLVGCLLLAGTGEAEEWSYPKYSCAICEGDKCTPIPCPDPPASCYQRMQEAMRAMDESHVLKPYRPRSSEEKEQDYQKEKARLDQWESTMADCVR